MTEKAAHSLLKVSIGANLRINHREVVDQVRQLLLLRSHRISRYLLILLRRRRQEEDELHDLGQVGLALGHILRYLEEDVEVPLSLLSYLLLPLFWRLWRL